MEECEVGDEGLLVHELDVAHDVRGEHLGEAEAGCVELEGRFPVGDGQVWRVEAGKVEIGGDAGGQGAEGRARGPGVLEVGDWMAPWRASGISPFNECLFDVFQLRRFII